MSGNSELLEAERRLGSVLKDKYRLDRILGVGGMAVVYAATHRNRRSFAIKMLHTQLSFIDELRVRFQREGYLANTVEHPGTVAVLDDDVGADGAAFLVMELLEGMGVDALVEKNGGKLPPREALALVYQLLDVLAAAHAKGIIHRDIKPANLFLDRTGQLKVLDFGIARLRDTTSSHLATGTGAQLGTPAFMSPEQALGSTSEIDASTDLWAVGATLFTLISGRLVHEAETGPQMLIYAATRPARSLSEVAPETPPSLVALVAKALAFQKSERFASASEMRADVLRVASELYGGVPGKEHLSRLVTVAAVAVRDTKASSGVPAEWQTPPVGHESISGTAGTELRPSRSPPNETASSVAISGIGRASTAPKRSGTRTAMMVVASVGLAIAGAWLTLSRGAKVDGAANDTMARAASSRVPAVSANVGVIVEPAVAPSVAPPAPSNSAAEAEAIAKPAMHPRAHARGAIRENKTDTQAAKESTAKESATQGNPLNMPIQ